jgi:ribose transport system substrate-binding protein
MSTSVLVSLLSDQQEFQLMQAADARAAAARAGLSVEVTFADNNAIYQIHQLFERIHAPEARRPAAIIVETVTGDSLERVARNALRAGIGWILLNGKAAGLKELRKEHDPKSVPVANVTVDQAEIGRIQARQLRRLLPGGGPVLYLEGPADTWATVGRRGGTQEALKGTGIELKALNGDWTEESGEKVVSAWLRLRTSDAFSPHAVAAQNDAMAVGARRALGAHRREWTDVPLIGCDGLPEGGQKLVGRGVLAATVVTPTTSGPAIDLVARTLAGETCPLEVQLAPRSYPTEADLARRPGPAARSARTS